MLRLPVAGLGVELTLPTGADDIALLEAGEPTVAVAVGLLAAVVRRIDGEPLDWTALTMADIDVLLLHLRRRVLGDRLSAEVVCRAPECGELVDIEFSVTEYLDHHRPRAPKRVATVDDTWFRLEGAEIELRLPAVSDQLAIAGADRGEEILVRRCLRPSGAKAAQRQRAEAAMEALAPSLASELQGSCPECGAAVTAFFDPLQYVLRELGRQAAYVYEEVWAIAERTHWPEADILALPSARRARYAGLAQPLESA